LKIRIENLSPPPHHILDWVIIFVTNEISMMVETNLHVSSSEVLALMMNQIRLVKRMGFQYQFSFSFSSSSWEHLLEKMIIKYTHTKNLISCAQQHFITDIEAQIELPAFV